MEEYERFKTDFRAKVKIVDMKGVAHIQLY